MKLPTRPRSTLLSIAMGSLIIALVFASALIVPSNAFQVPVPAYYPNRAVTLTGETLSIQAPPFSQTETSTQVPRGSSIYFYSQPLAEGQLTSSVWTITIYSVAGPGQTNSGMLTVELSTYSIDGTTQDALIGSSSGNTVSTTMSRLVIQLSGAAISVRNADRLTLRIYAETGSQNAASIIIYYDGVGVEPVSDPSRIETSAVLQETWTQDFEVNPFALSSVNRYWQTSGSGVTQDSNQYYTGSHSLHVSDTSSAGTFARYDFGSLNNPSYQGLPKGSTLSFHWLATTNGKGTGVLSIHTLIRDQGSSYEFYWYWSPISSSMPPSLYTSTTKSGGTYMGTIGLGSWSRNELYDWQKHAEVGLGVSFTNPVLVSISLQSLGAPAKSTDVYWDNIFVTSYTVTAQPTITQEGQTTTLTLTVTGAVPATTYQFEFAVVGPAGNKTISTISYTTGVTETSFTVFKHYPDDFQNGVSFVGSYNVTVRQLSPVYLLSEGTSFVPDYITTNTTFQVQLANKMVYQRTESVRIQANGYNTLERVTITITGPSGGYTMSVQADSTGLIVIIWQSPVDAALGNYTLRVYGDSTVKLVPDQGVFVLTPAVFSASQFSLERTSFERTQNVTVHASLSYPGQSLLHDGHVTVEVRRPDGLIMTQATADVQVSGVYTISVRVPSDAPTGGWTIALVAWGAQDSYGNSGPMQESVLSFTVIPAVLQVQSEVSINDTQIGRTLYIQASILYPDGSQSTSGRATAQLTHNGVVIGTVDLGYDIYRAMWTGLYQIKSTDPEGLWLIVISAQDLAGPVSNSIENVLHNVLIDAPPASYDYSTILVAGVIICAAALGALLLWEFPREKVLSVELETDKVMQTVNKVQSTDFFRSIRDQLKTVATKNE